MKLSQLAKKYPKAWKQYYLSKQCEGFFADDDIREYWSYITDFMDKQGIIIGITFFEEIKIFQGVLDYGDFVGRTDNFKSRSQAETEAIEKAFEILEGRSKRANT